MSVENNAARPAGGLTSDEPFVSGHGRAQAAIVLFLLYAAVCLFAILSNLLQLDLLSRVAAGGKVTPAEAAFNDLRQTAVALFGVVVFIAGLVVFLTWVHRAYRNLRALGNPERSISSSPGWAVGGFFIPFVNIYMPYKAVREIWELSDPGVRTEDDLMFSSPGTAPLVLVWWVVWLASGVFNFAVSRMAADAKTIDMLLWVTKGLILMRAVNIANALLTVLVVRGLDRRQEERARHVTYVPHTPPPPPPFTPQPPPPPQSA